MSLQQTGSYLINDKMNKLLLLLLILSQGSLSNAQERWGSYQGSIAGSHFVVVETCGDSAFISSSGPGYERLYVTIFDFVDSSMGRRIQGNSVFIDNLADNAPEYLLYDYSLQVGDSFQGDWGTFVVTSRTSEFTLGEPRTKIEMEDINSGHIDIWIKGLGSIVSGYLTPGMPENIPDAGATFSCYYDTQSMQTYFGNDDPAFCELDAVDIACPSVSTNPALEDFQMKVYPNPSIGEVTISFDTAGELNYDIINSLGQRLLRGKVYSGSVLDLSHLESGLYYMEFSDNTGLKTIKPVIVKSN